MKTIWKVGLIIGALLLVAVVCVWLYGRPLYHRLREQHFIRNAQDYQAKGDLRQAAISARQAIRENQTNVVAWRILAGIAAKAGIPTELEWRQRIVSIEPSLENRLDLIKCAMRRQDPPYPIAARAIKEAEFMGKESAAYHSIAAELAVKLRNTDEAEKHFAKACQLEPTNTANQLNLAVIHLGATNRALGTAARATLEKFGGMTNIGPAALNWLIADSLSRSNIAEAVVASKRLTAHPAAIIQDKIQNVGLLLQTKDPTLEEAIIKLKATASTSPADVLPVAEWMVSHGMATAALEWLRSLPREFQSQQPIPTAIVNCLVSLGEWTELQAFLKDTPWEELEFFRQAYLALAAWKLNQDSTAETHWRNATADAGERMRPLTMLSEMTRQWRRKDQYVEVLWMIADRFPAERWALSELNTIYETDANLRGLSRVYAAQLAFDPTNFALRNNLAASGLLLNQNPAEIAESFKPVWVEHTNNPAVATTYAYALHKQGKTADGLKIMERIPKEQLRLPAIATYYAVLLAESGRTNEAKPFVAIARSVRLLPEEKAILDKLPVPADQ